MRTVSLLLGLLAVHTGMAYAASGPVLHGRVLDYSTKQHHPVAHVAVAVQARRNGRTLTAVRGYTDALGRFALAAPPLSRGAAYTIVASYKGVSYETAIDPAQATRPLPLAVYDTTNSDAGLAAMRVVIGVRRLGRELAVIEQWQFANTGALSDVGADAASGRGAATFLLPSGATHVQIVPRGSMDAPATAVNGAVMVNTILRPATGLNMASLHQVTFAFNLPGGAGHPTLLIPTRYFIGSLNVFTVGSRLLAPGFKRTTLRDGGRLVPAWEAVAVPAGSTMAVGVDGPPVVATAVAGPAPFPDAGVGAMIGLGFIGLLLLGLLGRMRARRASRGQTALRRDYARLVAAIAELDLRHARGEVSPVQYDERRAEQKGRLLHVARQLGE